MRNSTLLLLLTFFLSSCELKENNQSATKKLSIVCTTGMLSDAVSNIVGDQAEVSALMGPGVDPHLYKASQGDLKLLSNSDVIVYNGLHLEGKMGEIFEKLKNRKTIIIASDAVPKEELINTTAFQGAYDPHLWFDVATWSKVVDYLGRELSTINQLSKEKISSNSNQYQTQLEKLHHWVAKEIQKIDPDKRVLITAHDAFGYFGRAYDIEVRGLQGISTQSEYGLRDVSELVNFITDRKIKAVFVESSVSNRSLKAVVEGCQSRGHTMEIGGTLYSDAMGEKGTAEGNYIGMVKHNVKTIIGGLK